MKRISEKLVGLRLLPQVLTGLTVICACTLLFFTNTGCDIIGAISGFAIQFSPPYFALSVPGQQGVVKATLVWSDSERNLEAKTWTVDAGLPPVLESVTWSPKENSVFTDISLKCSSDSSRFGASDLWASSASSSYMVGVKATFVEPVWKSVSGGQEAILARKAFLPLRLENPRVTITQLKHFPVGNSWMAIFHVVTQNPVEGWTYKVKAYAREIAKATGEVTNLVSDEWTWQGAGGADFPGGGMHANPSDAEFAAYVVFEITYRNHLGTLVREERKVFSY